MFRITSRRVSVALGLAAAIAVAGGIQLSSAQTAPRGLPNYQNQQPDRQFDRRDNPANGGQTQNDRRGGRDAQAPEQRLDRRLSVLHDRLRITPAQERGWTALASAMREEMGERGRDRGDRRDANGRQQPPSVVERLERREQRLAGGTQRLDHVLNALRPLYASFSDEQRRTADRLMFQAEERVRGRGGRGFEGRGPNGPDFGRNGPPPRPDDRQDRNTTR